MMKIDYKHNGIEFSVTAHKRRTERKSFGRGYSGDPTHYTYTITIKRGEVAEDFKFHDSIYNYQRGITETEDMINGALDCIISEYYDWKNCSSAEDFAEEFGYDYYEEKRHVNAVWKAISKNGEKVERLFSEDEIEEISTFVSGLA